MSTKIDLGGLKVDSDLAKLVEDEIIPGTGVDVNKFWAGLGGIVKDLAPRNRQLLDKRDDIQKKIDEYHLKTNRVRILGARIRSSSLIGPTSSTEAPPSADQGRKESMLMLV
eukprot:1861451-Rhodomonas_salina.4